MDVVKLAIIASLAVATPAAAQSRTPYTAHVAEASARFGVPEAWIRSVMRLESAGDPAAISHAGAMGLMQIMPATWRYLSARYRLGGDPYEPRANILAGAAYLRELYDRYGSPAFLAAYNAGPGRVDAWLLRGRPLPTETRRYVAAMTPVMRAPRPALAAPAEEPPPPTLFAVRYATSDGPRADAGEPSADGLFAMRRQAEPAAASASDVQPD